MMGQEKDRWIRGWTEPGATAIHDATHARRVSLRIPHCVRLNGDWGWCTYTERSLSACLWPILLTVNRMVSTEQRLEGRGPRSG